MTTDPLSNHRSVTRTLARKLDKTDIYHWLCEHGYFPESYVLPPCFRVVKHPTRPKAYFTVTGGGKKYSIPPSECVNVHFPKTEFTDRNFGLMHPEHFNDIAYHISRNWVSIVDAMIPANSSVASYSFPIPINSKTPGRLSFLRSGRLIYEFIGMVDDDLASISYRFKYLVKADIKSFYPSIYTHSIAWALHGKKSIRKPKRIGDFNILGNKLDKLFQYANDRCTNGIPIGPVVSDIIAEIIASAVDVLFTKRMKASSAIYRATRFKDDYRILVRTEQEAKSAIKALQASLKEFSLELSDEKTQIHKLPNGLFREWVSKYHLAYPRKRRTHTWKQFRELYLSVVQIDKECPGTGVIDRFLADIVTRKGDLKLSVHSNNIEKAISMLLMLGDLRVKAYPKIIAILESIIRTPFGTRHERQIVGYLQEYLLSLSTEEERNKYLISWISYFLVSNDLDKHLTNKPKYKDPITRSILNNRGAIFKGHPDYTLFQGCKTIAKKMTMFEHLDIFKPPKIT